MQSQTTDFEQDILLAFAFFDPHDHGFITKHDAWVIIHSIGLRFSQRHALALIEPALNRDRLYYKAMVQRTFRARPPVTLPPFL
jgi:Ca2+-binding EF-hand superfamily protein